MNGPTFPHFDDFLVRSTVNVIFQAPKNYEVLTNSQKIGCDEMQLFSAKKANSWSSCFESIPNISIHDLIFSISTFSYKKQIWMGKEIRIWTRPNLANYTSFALKILPSIMSKLADIFKTSYSQSKLDFVAIPDYAPDQIAGPGLIALPEYSLLHDESSKSNLDMIRILKSVSKACTSMWLQNFIRLENQTWLVDGLIEYYKYFLVEKVRDFWFGKNSRHCFLQNLFFKNASLFLGKTN